MPCWLVVRVEIEDEESAREALKAMGYDERDIRYMLTVQRGKPIVKLSSRSEEGPFKQQYGVAFAKKQAKKTFFHFKKQEVLKNGAIKITFKK